MSHFNLICAHLFGATKCSPAPSSGSLRSAIVHSKRGFDAHFHKHVGSSPIQQRIDVQPSSSRTNTPVFQSSLLRPGKPSCCFLSLCFLDSAVAYSLPLTCAKPFIFCHFPCLFLSGHIAYSSFLFAHCKSCSTTGLLSSFSVFLQWIRRIACCFALCSSSLYPLWKSHMAHQFFLVPHHRLFIA